MDSSIYYGIGLLLVIIAVYMYRKRESYSPYLNNDLAAFKGLPGASCMRGSACGKADIRTMDQQIKDSFKPHLIDFLGNDAAEIYYDEDHEEALGHRIHGM
jgi:hypothetical protein